jgi:hypothetical protein
MVAVQAGGSSTLYKSYARTAAAKDSSSETGHQSKTHGHGKTGSAASAWFTSGSGGVQCSVPRMSADSMGALLQQQSTYQQNSFEAKWNDAPIGPRRTPDGEPALQGFGYNLSTGEKEMFTAITGFTFDSIGGAIGPDGKACKCPGQEIMSQIGAERQAGVLKGSITPQALRDMAKRLAENGQKLDSALVDKAVEYLTKNQR